MPGCLPPNHTVICMEICFWSSRGDLIDINGSGKIGAGLLQRRAWWLLQWTACIFPMWTPHRHSAPRLPPSHQQVIKKICQFASLIYFTYFVNETERYGQRMLNKQRQVTIRVTWEKFFWFWVLMFLRTQICLLALESEPPIKSGRVLVLSYQRWLCEMVLQRNRNGTPANHTPRKRSGTIVKNCLSS